MTKDSNKTAIISIRVRPEIKAGIEELAREDRRPLAAYLEIMIEDRIKAARMPSKPRKA
jgi:hypothetical protein